MTSTKNRMTAIIASAVSAACTLVLLIMMLPNLGGGKQTTAVRVSVPDLPARLDQKLSAMGPLVTPNPEGGMAAAAALAQANRPVYAKLNDDDLIAPMPDPKGYGMASTVAELNWLEQAAAPLLDGQKLYFGGNRPLLPGSEIKYYMDDTILTVTWKEPEQYAALTFAEVKIADASQFRRFLAGGKFGADTQFTTTEMAQSVNAVLASSGDFYKFRYNGVVVYGGEVRRVNTNKADTCYINDAGDLIFTYQNSVFTQEEAQKFVDDNHIRFSLTFGPVLVDKGERCEPQTYDIGEINSFSPRAAICQLGPLHYLLITSNAEPDVGYPGALNMHQFTDRIVQTGCEKAYALDGGQTAALALDGKLVNRVLYNQQRTHSDIIYFATAVGG